MTKLTQLLCVLPLLSFVTACNEVKLTVAIERPLLADSDNIESSEC